MSSECTVGVSDEATSHDARCEPNDSIEETPLRVRRSLAHLTGEELNDLNAKLAPALEREREFDAFWSTSSARGDVVAALAAGLAAAACRSAVHEVSSSWFAIRKITLAVEDFDAQPPSSNWADDAHSYETSEQALDRLVSEIAEQDEETLAPLVKTLGRFGMRTLDERLRQLRACPELSNPNGILRGHPPASLTALFRTLLISPVVHDEELQDDLSEISALRRDARHFRDKIHAFDEYFASKEENAPRRFLPNVPADESERFRDSLDALCAGDVRTRHQHEHAGRIAIIRDVADHFRRFLNITRGSAAEMFRLEPWSAGIAALAHAGLNTLVTTEDVRGALKNWSSD